MCSFFTTGEVSVGTLHYDKDVAKLDTVQKRTRRMLGDKKTFTQPLHVGLIHTKQDADMTDKVSMRTFVGPWWITVYFSPGIQAHTGDTIILSLAHWSRYLV